MRTTCSSCWVLALLFFVGCGGSDESCTEDSLRCEGDTVQRCVANQWQDWDECGAGKECLLVAGQSMCVEEDCDPDCEGKECGSNGCGGQCGVCPEGVSCENGECVEKECENSSDCEDGYYCDANTWTCVPVP
ncbi:MAG: hypothetical protein JXR96_17300 [Deltaproteobacteria bacterium]|nr:hypothetical protein [Deltaproteobacteria bacterium]